MPEYTYECEACQHTFDTFQSIHDNPKKKCPECKKNKLFRVIYAPFISIVSEPKTVGHLAARNTDKMSQDELSERIAKDKIASGESEKPKDKQPWWRKGKVNKKLANMTPKQTKDYIEKGRTP